MSEHPWEPDARRAGWLPPAEVEVKLWKVRHLKDNGERCAHCGAVRVRGPISARWWARHNEPSPHRTYCQFYSGPVKHGFANGHMGSFSYWISCTCGRSYPEYDADGNKNECPDIALTHREPQVRDRTADGSLMARDIEGVQPPPAG